MYNTYMYSLTSSAEVYTYSVVKIILNLTILQLIYTYFIEIHSEVKEG